MIDFLKSFILGIVEGITEWLPISSTGHMILFNEFTNTTKGFLTSDVFLYVIQLGAILAIATLYFKKLNPFTLPKTDDEKENTWKIAFLHLKKDTMDMWFKVIVACIPAAVIGLLLNDFMENFENPYVISSTLIIYGILFLFIERKNKNAKISSMEQMSYKTAIMIGLFQVLSIIPGTSRSGSTILGAMILGCSRGIAAEFSFFLAIPVMFGVSFLKLVTNDMALSSTDWGLLVTGMITAYIVSLLSVNFLVNYVRKHDFKVFGYYRIVLGIIVLAFFGIKLFL